MIRSAPESDARVDPDEPHTDRDENGRAPRGGMASRTFGSLFRQLRDDAMKLVRKEAELAKYEIRQEVAQTIKDASLLIAAGVLAHTAMLFLLAGIAFALWIGFWALGPAWAIAGLALAPILVALALGAAAAVLFRAGQKDLEERDPTPRQTVASLEEDKQWIQNKVSQ